MKLTIFGGISGFDKTKFILKFIVTSLESLGYSADLEHPESKAFIQYIKFEDVLLEVTDSVNIPRFLAKPSLHEKINSIERAFSRIGTQIKESHAEHIFLDIHFSCTYQSQFFPPIYKANLSELDPGPDSEIRVITLIDDVYNIWNNLKKRETEFHNTSLRLREILAWRSVELLQTEAVALNYTSETRRVTNYLFAVRHPVISLFNLVFSENPICLYLSYPISKTRNDPSRVEDINEFRRRMYGIAEDLGVVIFDPVTIDEFPLRNAPVEDGFRILTNDQRWPLEIELIVDEPDWPIKIPVNEVHEAQDDIRNNIQPRDFKLIDPSIFTTVYRKNFGGLSTGVGEEIRYTISRGKIPYVYDPDVDEDGEIHPFDADEYGYRDKEEFYADIIRGIENYQARRGV